MFDGIVVGCGVPVVPVVAVDVGAVVVPGMGAVVTGAVAGGAVEAVVGRVPGAGATLGSGSVPGAPTVVVTATVDVATVDVATVDVVAVGCGRRGLVVVGDPGDVVVLRGGRGRRGAADSASIDRGDVLVTRAATGCTPTASTRVTVAIPNSRADEGVRTSGSLSSSQGGGAADGEVTLGPMPARRRVAESLRLDVGDLDVREGVVVDREVAAAVGGRPADGHAGGGFPRDRRGRQRDLEHRPAVEQQATRGRRPVEVMVTDRPAAKSARSAAESVYSPWVPWMATEKYGPISGSICRLTPVTMFAAPSAETTSYPLAVRKSSTKRPFCSGVPKRSSPGR